MAHCLVKVDAASGNQNKNMPSTAQLLPYNLPNSITMFSQLCKKACHTRYRKKDERCKNDIIIYVYMSTNMDMIQKICIGP